MDKILVTSSQFQDTRDIWNSKPCCLVRYLPRLYSHNPPVALMSPVPYTAYTFDVLANMAAGFGKVSIPRFFTTLQAPPTSPLNVTINSLSYRSLRVSWSPPKCSNGIITGYMVRKELCHCHYCCSHYKGDVQSINWLSSKPLQCLKYIHYSTSKHVK